MIALRKSILGQDFMGKSGNHEPDVYNYIVAAAKKASVLTKLGVFPIYYFLLKASHCEDFDKRFTPFLAPGMEGSSHKPGTAPASGKKRAQPEADDGLVTVMKQLVDSQQAAFEVQAESAKSKRHKESMRGRLQERQLALAERQQELAEAQQMVDLRGRLMGQLKEATALLAQAENAVEDEPGDKWDHFLRELDNGGRRPEHEQYAAARRHCHGDHGFHRRTEFKRSYVGRKAPEIHATDDY